MNMIDFLLPSKPYRIYYLIAIGVLFIFYPYIFMDFLMPSMNSSLTIYTIVGVMLFGFNIISNNKQSAPLVFWLSIFVVCIGLFIQYSVKGEIYYLQKIVMIFTAVNLIFFCNWRIGTKSFFFYYNRWIYVMAIGGVIGSILAIVGVSPFFSCESLNDGRPIYTWFVTCTKMEMGTMRFSGFFDEPGAFGYWVVFAMAINKLFINDKRIEWPLMFMTFLTFSLGFFAQAALYYVFFGLKDTSLTKKLALIEVVFLGYIFILSTQNTDLSFIYDNSIGRIEATQNAQSFLEGTNREWLMDRAKDLWEQNPMWGADSQSRQAIGYFGDNMYETLANDGIFGCCYLYFPYVLLLVLGIFRRDYDAIGVALFCAMSVFHRPIHANLLTYFMLYSLPFVYGLRYYERKNNDEWYGTIS